MPLALVSGAVSALYLPEKILDMTERRICGDGDTVQRYVDILSDAGDDGASRVHARGQERPTGSPVHGGGRYGVHSGDAEFQAEAFLQEVR